MFAYRPNINPAQVKIHHFQGYLKGFYQRNLHHIRLIVELVRPVGFEPTTTYFVDRYSIQLS